MNLLEVDKKTEAVKNKTTCRLEFPYLFRFGGGGAPAVDELPGLADFNGLRVTYPFWISFAE